MDGESSESTVHQFALTYQLLRKALGSMIDERLIPRAVLSTFFFATVPYSEARIKTILEAQGGCDIAEHSYIDMPCPYELQFNASGAGYIVCLCLFVLVGGFRRGGSTAADDAGSTYFVPVSRLEFSTTTSTT